jgi:hypothetical protein
MIFTPDRRPKIILPATFSLSNPNDPAFNNTLLKEIGPTASFFRERRTGIRASTS